VVEIAGAGPAYSLVRLDAAGTPILSRIVRKAVVDLELQPGLLVHVQVGNVDVIPSFWRSRE